MVTQMDQVVQLVHWFQRQKHHCVFLHIDFSMGFVFLIHRIFQQANAKIK